ncbi:MAG: sensor histidine kinase [Planctomycetota bacterium]
MTISLRLRVLLFIAAINVAVFGAGLYFLAGRIGEQRAAQAREFAELLDYTLPATINPRGELKVAQILRWPHWRHFHDAILVDKNLERVHDELVPQGVFLNPVGNRRRTADFDRRAVLDDIELAIAQRQRVETAAGAAVPILDPEGGVWGGCWYRIEPSIDPAALTRGLLPWFLVSTLLLTLGTFAMLSRFVLGPVAAIARGAERVAAGDLSVRLPEPPRRDEVSDLVRRFNTMTATVQGFNEHLAREVERATEDVRRAQTAAMTQRRLAATGELAAGIAHEINNPLGGLLNATETLARQDLPRAKQAEYFALLKNGLERIQATVGKLLRFTPRSASPVPMSLVDPVLDAVALVQHRAQKQQVEIVFAPEGVHGLAPHDALDALRALPLVRGQSGELAQAILNLLMNSLDALEERPRTSVGGGRVDVRLAREDRELVLTVQDDGPGVAAADLPRIADLFYTTKEVGRGTGLGLSLVHTTVAAHGGSVHLTSPPGRGLRVEIRLPIWSDGAAAQR